MIIDGHTHASARCEADWDFLGVAEHMKHEQRILTGMRCKVKKMKDDSVVKDGWKTLWDESLLNSWDGRYEVNLRVAWEKDREYAVKFHPPIYVWEKEGEKYYADGPYVKKILKAPPPELLLELMDKVGIDRAVLQLPPVDLNKFFARVVHEYPRRFIGLCHIDEDVPYTKENIEKLHIYVEELGLRGMYHEPLRDWDGYDNFHTDKFDPFWAEVESMGVPVNIGGPYHTEKLIPKLAALLKKFPKLTLVITNGILPYYMKNGITDVLSDIIKNYDVQTEILPLIVDYGPKDELIRLLYDAFGASKIVWGSEFAAYEVVGPPFYPEKYVQYLEYIEKRCPYMSESDIELIHGDNLKRVYGL